MKGAKVFAKLFRRKHVPTIATQPVGEIFPWPKDSVLRPLDRLMLAIPSAVLGQDEAMSEVINCDDNAEIAIPEGDDKIYIRLKPGMAISLSRSVQAIVLPWSEGETEPKRIEIVDPPEAEK